MISVLMPTQSDQELAASNAPQLEGCPKDLDFVELTVSAGGEKRSFAIPPVALRFLAEVLAQVAQGHAVTIASLQTELTTQQAADYLGVSRPYLVKLLEAGEIPFRRLQKHRRVRLEDVVGFQERSQAQRELALDELSALSQELGLYD